MRVPKILATNGRRQGRATTKYRPRCYRKTPTRFRAVWFQWKPYHWDVIGQIWKTVLSTAGLHDNCANETKFFCLG